MEAVIMDIGVTFDFFSLLPNNMCVFVEKKKHYQ